VERSVSVHPAAIVLEDNIVVEALVEISGRLIDTRDVAINEVNELVLLQRITQNTQLGVRNLVVAGAAIALEVLGDASLDPLKCEEGVVAEIAGECVVELLVKTVEMKTVILYLIHEV